MAPKRQRTTVRLLLCSEILILAAGTDARSESATQPLPDRPNILFALADDWGWPHAGAYGEAAVQTPTFDRLAREGVLFEHAYVSSPSCTPCRNSILTGQQFYRLGEGANLHSTLDVSQPNFMMLLRSSGYQIGHWRKAWGPGDFKKGGYTEHPCGPGSRFDKFLQNRDPDKPFCFWFGTSDPHRPYQFDSWRQHGVEPDEVPVPGFFPDSEQVRGDIADYYVEVERWDREVGEALELLEQAGELENTLVVMSGDHGMPFPRCKTNLYDWGVRVPLAVRWGGAVRPGQRVADFVSLPDLAPTFLEAAGVEVPNVMTVKSLLPLLKPDGPQRSDPERVFVVFGRERHTPAQAMPSMAGYPMRGLRNGRWLLILNLEPDRWPAGVPEGATHPMGSHADCDDGPTKQFIIAHRKEPAAADQYRLCFAKRPPVELYDCQADPDQLHNLADDPEHADTVETLRTQLTTYLADTGDPRFTDGPVRFDEYLYRAAYLEEHLEQQGFATPAQQGPVRPDDETQGAASWVELIGGNGPTGVAKIGRNMTLCGDVRLKSGSKGLQAEPGSGVVAVLSKVGYGIENNLHSKSSFGDCEVRLEFLIGKGSNSGVKLQGRYEVQLFDSHDTPKPSARDCGGIYPHWLLQGPGIPLKYIDKGYPPATNAAKPAGQWQTLRIVFQAPTFDADGKKTKNARIVSVVLNDQQVQRDVELDSPTGNASTPLPEVAKAPLMLQLDHGAVAFRNVRVKPLGL